MSTVPKYTGDKSLGSILEEGAGKQKRFFKIVKALEPIKCPAQLKVTPSQVLSQIGTLKGKINKIKKDLPYEKNKKKKTELKNKIKSLETELNKKIKMYQDLKKKKPVKVAEKKKKPAKKKQVAKKESPKKGVLPIEFQQKRGVLKRKIRLLNREIMQEEDDEKAEEIDKQIMEAVKKLEDLHDQYGVPFEE